LRAGLVQDLKCKSNNSRSEVQERKLKAKSKAADRSVRSTQNRNKGGGEGLVPGGGKARGAHRKPLAEVIL
jgi:hypothetical protein